MPCKGRNHFRCSTQCSRTVHSVQDGSDSDSSCTNYGDISSVTADVHTLSSDNNGPIFCHMLVRKQSVEMQVDCGSTVNILPKKYVEDKDIRQESATLKMWNNVKTEALGKYRAKTVNPATGDKFNVDYVIMDDDEQTPLLSRKAAERMKSTMKMLKWYLQYLDLALLVLLVLKTILTCLMVKLDPSLVAKFI